VKRAALVAFATAAYIVAAWLVAPGFYDGFGPRAPYNWTCPPPQAGANQKPSSGHVDIKVINGASDADSAFTDDGQIVMGFLPGAFDITGKTSVSVDIAPTTTCPQPAGIQFVTNVYHITASAPLLKDSNLVLLFSSLMLAPTDIYVADDPAGPWKTIPTQPQSQPYTIVGTTRSFGYFAAGYKAGSTSGGGGAGTGGVQLLPIIVAGLIVLVVLAGLPLAILRRRRGRGGEGQEDEDEDDEREDGDEGDSS
jgi:hypothetical protein